MVVAIIQEVPFHFIAEAVSRKKANCWLDLIYICNNCFWLEIKVNVIKFYSETAGRQWATSCKILVASAEFSVALATLKAQFQTLDNSYRDQNVLFHDQLIR